MSRLDTTLCPRFHHAAEIIGRRWTGAILRVMLGGATRFNELKRAIPDISDKMLSERLKELEAEGILTRTVSPTTPVRIDYRLTEKGEALRPVLAGIGAWADAWVPKDEAEPA